MARMNVASIHRHPRRRQRVLAALPRRPPLLVNRILMTRAHRRPTIVRYPDHNVLKRDRSESSCLSSDREIMPDQTDAKKGSIRALQLLNFFIADVQNGMGPYMALFLNSSAGWGPGQIGVALSIGNFAGVIAQTPAGALIDHARKKRWLVISGALLVTIACLVMAFFTTMPVVATGQGLIGIAGAIFPPALAALALGLVGRKKLDRQMGKNQAINSAGNVFAAILLGVAGYYFSLRAMFYVLPVLCGLAILCILRVKNEDVDYEMARGADCAADSKDQENRSVNETPDSFKSILHGLGQLWNDKHVRIFLICVVLFHFSNAALMPLVAQLLTVGGDVKQSVLYTSGFMVASQLVFVVVGALSGWLAGSWGRKPLFLIAFAALALRAGLFTITRDPVWLMAIQALDGFGAGVFGVVSVLIIADLTQGTGRFNVAQGAVATATGSGATLSNFLAGLIVKHGGFNIGFAALGIVGFIGFALFLFFMPETLNQRHKTCDSTKADGDAASDKVAIPA